VDNLRDTMASASLKIAQIMANSGDKSYVYYFDHRPPGRDDRHYGAFHSSDLVYECDNLDAVNRPWTEADKKLADMMSSYWANFAATGNPNHAGLPDWPPFDKESDLALELGDTVRARAIPSRSLLKELNANHFSLAF